MADIAAYSYELIHVYAVATITPATLGLRYTHCSEVGEVAAVARLNCCV
jgi:hypothetical protein